MPRKQRSCTIACQICMVFYGFLSCSSFCIRHVFLTCPKARSSPQSRELCCHAARGSLIISTRACSESPQDSAGSEGLWLGAIYSIEHRELQAALENDGKKTRTPQHTHAHTHTDTDTDTAQPLKLVKLIFKNPATLEKKHRFGTCEPNQVQTANFCKHHQTSAHHTRTGL